MSEKIVIYLSPGAVTSQSPKFRTDKNGFLLLEVLYKYIIFFWLKLIDFWMTSNLFSYFVVSYGLLLLPNKFFLSPKRDNFEWLIFFTYFIDSQNGPSSFCERCRKCALNILFLCNWGFFGLIFFFLKKIYSIFLKFSFR